MDSGAVPSCHSPVWDAHGQAEHGGIWELLISTAACFCTFCQEQFLHLSGQSKHNLLLSSSAFKRSCLLTDYLASPARHAWWPQTLHLCSSCTWESRADPGERAHLQCMGTGKAPASGAENQAGNHCNNFSLHRNKKNPDFSLSFQISFPQALTTWQRAWRQ